MSTLKNKKAETVFIYDSTLRDGAQGEGINFSVEDKLSILTELDAFGVHYIEAGNPGSNPKDLEFFKKAGGLTLKNAKLVAFGSTRRKNILPEEDANVISLLAAETPVVAIFGKSWDLHVTEVLNTTLDENLNMIKSTVAFFKERGKETVFDAEHFFDGYKNNPDYAIRALKAAAAGGADSLCLCDTNGGCFPEEIYEITSAVRAALPHAALGIHCHNDGGCAVANSLAAVRAGTRQVQGCFVGVGERTGNANLAVIIPSLQLKMGFACVPDLTSLTLAARAVADITNITLENTMPYVGLSAFTHKAGMHADGVLKCAHSFEHINPEVVGNDRRFLLSEIAGRNAIVNKIQKYFPHLSKDSPETAEILKLIKENEHGGYQYESAEASFKLLVYKAVGKFKPSFELISFKLICEQPAIEGVSATAAIKIRAGGKTHLASSDGAGPVFALDHALRKALSAVYPDISKISLSDYKVRVLDGHSATAAAVRVLITTTDGVKSWTTVGVSTDIIDASYKALTDSLEYRLMTGGKPPMTNDE